MADNTNPIKNPLNMPSKGDINPEGAKGNVGSSITWRKGVSCNKVNFDISNCLIPSI